jgi:hypothetical protein
MNRGPQHIGIFNEQKESMTGEGNKDRHWEKNSAYGGISIVTLHKALLLLHAADEYTSELQFELYGCEYKSRVQEGQDGLGG